MIWGGLGGGSFILGALFLNCSMTGHGAETDRLLLLQKQVVRVSLVGRVL